MDRSDAGRTSKNPEIFVTPSSKLAFSTPLQSSAGLPEGSTERRTNNARLNSLRLIARAESKYVYLR